MAKKTRKAGHGNEADALKDALLEAALPDAAFDGWNDGLLARAGAKLGLINEEIQTAFPGGARGLACHFSDWADRQALERLGHRMPQTPRVRDKIALGVRTRLEILAPHKQAVAAALAFLGLPPRNLLLPKMVWRTADLLWRAAGDVSTDYNHYTKRLLLSGVLTSTTLFWLNDASEQSAGTWEFLDRRIEEVLKIGRKISSFKKPAGEEPGAGKSHRTKYRTKRRKA